MVDDIGESLGHLNSIICLARRNEVSGMADIGGGKLGWTTSSGFLQVRTLFMMSPRDGQNMNTSGRGNRMTRMTRIKHSENGTLLGG